MSRERYAVQFQNAVASPSVTAATIVAATTVRPEIYEMELGSSASPADNALVWYLQRLTAAGTNTSYTAGPVDGSSGMSARSTCGVTNTVEPTYTAGKYLFHLPLNQRATHRWAAQSPEGHFRAPATANNGFGLLAAHASFTDNVDGTIWFEE